MQKACLIEESGAHTIMLTSLEALDLSIVPICTSFLDIFSSYNQIGIKMNIEYTIHYLTLE